MAPYAFIKLLGFSQSDIGVTKIISPVGTSNVYDSTFITVQVHNYGLGKHGYSSL
jgi:hypothetical protein